MHGWREFWDAPVFRGDDESLSSIRGRRRRLRLFDLRLIGNGMGNHR
jgi:hypothetical protein